MRYVVIGGTAFAGKKLVQQMSAAGDEVLLFHRGLTPADPLTGAAEVIGDRSDLYDFRERFKEFAPDVVVDMICMTEHHMRTSLDTFEDIASRLVVISSQDVYRAFGRVQGIEGGAPDQAPLTEDSPLREQLYLYRGHTDPKYSWSRDYEKIMVERVAQNEARLPVTVLRLPAVYGPGDYQRRMLGYASRMSEGRPAILLEAGMAAWRWTRGYVDNVASAIHQAAGDDRASGQTYNVGEPTAFTEVEWVRKIGDAVGWQGKIVVVDDERFATGINADQPLAANTSRLRDELGWKEPIPLPDALRTTYEWEVANPPPGLGVSPDRYEAEDEVLSQIDGLQ